MSEPMQSEKIDEIAKALSKAQGQFKAVPKDQVNPFFNSKYSSLSIHYDSSYEALGKNGLSVVQTTDYDEAKIILITTLIHDSGQWIRGWLPLSNVKQDPQGVGSGLSYARRYALAAILGLASEDDDAEKAMEGSKRDKQESKPNSEPSKKEQTELIDDGEFLITFGKKYKNRKINEIPEFDLMGYVEYMKTEIRKSGKPPHKDVATFLDHADRFLDRGANQDGMTQ